MKKEIILANVRHLMTLIGGILVTTKVVTDQDWQPIMDAAQSIVGAGFVLCSFIWSIVRKVNRADAEAGKGVAPFASLIMCAVLCQGCLSAKVTFPDGTTASVHRPVILAGKSALSNFEATSANVTTNGSTNVSRVVVRGYVREDNETMAGLINAAAAGAVQGYKASNGIP